MKDKNFNAMIQKGIKKSIKQNAKAVSIGINGNVVCKYLDDDGNSCPVGHMMTKKELKCYGDQVDPVTVIHDMGWRPRLTNKQLTTLSVIQECHDEVDRDAPFAEDFVDELIGMSNLDNSIKQALKELDII
jgi:hypothetical protein